MEQLLTKTQYDQLQQSTIPNLLNTDSDSLTLTGYKQAVCLLEHVIETVNNNLVSKQYMQISHLISAMIEGIGLHYRLLSYRCTDQPVWIGLDKCDCSIFKPNTFGHFPVFQKAYKSRDIALGIAG